MSEALTRLLLEDRAKRAERERERLRNLRKARPVGADFDPYQITQWRVVAGGDPGYLPKTPMRMGKDGFWIACKGCGNKFESKGWAYCPTCMELPAETRHALRPSGRECAAPGCDKVIAPTARVDAAYCSEACAQKARRARRPYENDVPSPDIGSPQNVGSTPEITQQNQGSKTEPKNTEAPAQEAFDQIRGDRVLSDWEPIANLDPNHPGFEIPEFLRRPQ